MPSESFDYYDYRCKIRRAIEEFEEKVTQEGALGYVREPLEELKKKIIDDR